MVDEKRAEMKNLKGNDGTMLSLMLEHELFKNDDDLIVDEINTIFFGGMDTIKAATANLIYYMAKNPEIKAQLLAEVLPAV
jgi:cytochrome P450